MICLFAMFYLFMITDQSILSIYFHIYILFYIWHYVNNELFDFTL